MPTSAVPDCWQLQFAPLRKTQLQPRGEELLSRNAMGFCCSCVTSKSRPLCRLAHLSSMQKGSPHPHIWIIKHRHPYFQQFRTLYGSVKKLVLQVSARISPTLRMLCWRFAHQLASPASKVDFVFHLK